MQAGELFAGNLRLFGPPLDTVRPSKRRPNLRVDRLPGFQTGSGRDLTGPGNIPWGCVLFSLSGNRMNIQERVDVLPRRNVLYRCLSYAVLNPSPAGSRH